ncbi:transposase [bacterium]|nr:transposase [bacterium]
MKRIFFETDEIYHVYNRGTDKRDIFLEKSDYAKFLDYLVDFNNLKPIDKEKLKEERRKSLKRGQALECLDIEDDPLVDVLGFCLMPNHFHLLLRQRMDGGIAKFIQRVATGYVMVFNTKQKRSGCLFQGRFKATHINTQEYLDYLIFYIHFNPLSLIRNSWLNDKKLLIDFLAEYQWSSHIDYLSMDETSNSPIEKSFFYDNFKNNKVYMKKSKEWLEIIQEKNKMKEFIAKAIDYE